MRAPDHSEQTRDRRSGAIPFAEALLGLDVLASLIPCAVLDVLLTRENRRDEPSHTLFLLRSNPRFDQAYQHTPYEADPSWNQNPGVVVHGVERAQQHGTEKQDHQRSTRPTDDAIHEAGLAANSRELLLLRLGHWNVFSHHRRLLHRNVVTSLTHVASQSKRSNQKDTK